MNSFPATIGTKVLPPVIGAGGTTATGNVTLTSASPGAMTITPTNAGAYVTLPDATTCSKGTTLFSVYNASADYDLGVKDSAGTKLGWIRPNSGALIGLADSSTAAGIWAYYGLEKTGITAKLSSVSITNQAADLRIISLDASRTCAIFRINGGNLNAVVFDASALTWGSIVTVRASTSISYLTAILQAANQVLVASCQTTTFNAVVLSISGTAITVNAAASLVVGEAPNAYQYTIAAVGSTYVASYNVSGAGVARFMPMTVSGTTVTLGTETTVNTCNTTPLMFVSGSYLRFLTHDSSSINCKPYSFSGVTPSAGTIASVVISSGGSSYFRGVINGSGNIVCAYLDSSAYKASIFKLTGSTEAVTSVNMGSPAPGGGSGYHGIENLSATKTAVMWQDSSTGIAYVNIVTDTSGTASIGTKLSVNTITGITNLIVCKSSATSVQFTLSGTTRVVSITADCSGASPTLTNFGELYAVPTSIFPVLYGAPLQDGTYPAGYLATNSGSRILGFLLGYCFDVVVNPTSIYIKPSTLFPGGGSATGYVNQLSSRAESWVLVNALGSATYVVKVEAAA